MGSVIAASLPAEAGAGFKPGRFGDILSGPQPIGFVEIQADAYMGAGGEPHAQLRKLCEKYSLSVYDRGLSIGGVQPLCRAHLARLKSLCDRYQPASFSEPLAWSAHGEVFLNALLPLPYGSETRDRVVAHVDLVQNTLGRQMLLENPATYVRFEKSPMSEGDFLDQIARRTGCGLLLDLNSAFVSARNHGADPDAYMASFPLAHVREIHIGGHEEQTDDAGAPLLIASRATPVADAVWALYAGVIERAGPLPTLIEWDDGVPAWSALADEARRARTILRRASRSRQAA
jgi:uncharacterized protein (UPF0276 family)